MSKLVIFTEDSSATAFKSLKRLVNTVVVTEKLNIDSIEEASEGLKTILHANNWKSDNPPPGREAKVTFNRLLTSELTKNKKILWHFDGDKKFSDYKVDECEKVIALKALIEKLPNELQSRSGKTLQVEKGNIIYMIPCYSIEAWLFQNKLPFQELLDKHKQQLSHITSDKVKSKKEQIISDLDFLANLSLGECDELWQIKKKFPGSEAKQYYPKFAEAIPHAKVMAIKKSYYNFVSSLKEALS